MILEIGRTKTVDHNAMSFHYMWPDERANYQRCCTIRKPFHMSSEFVGLVVWLILFFYYTIFGTFPVCCDSSIYLYLYIVLCVCDSSFCLPPLDALVVYVTTQHDSSRGGALQTSGTVSLRRTRRPILSAWDVLHSHGTRQTSWPCSRSEIPPSPAMVRTLSP